MISRLPGAILRAVLVVLLVATPSLMLVNVGTDTAQIVALVCLIGAALTIFEYSSTYPSFVEFREAPPFNRVRFGTLFVTVFLLSLISGGTVDSSTLTRFLSAVGTLIGVSIDFPYSPVRLVVLMMPESASVELLSQVRTAAGLSYLISLLSLAFFSVALRMGSWPKRDSTFNVWVNLPTFDPTAGGDVVERLRRDGRVNIILGFLLPFVIPAVVKLASDIFDPISLANPQTLIWTMAAWAFLPSSLFMRGIAMGRVAQMIEDKRRRAHDKAARDSAAKERHALA